MEAPRGEGAGKAGFSLACFCHLSACLLVNMRLAVVLSALACAVAQDPAQGWMAYAVGQVPKGTQRITHMEMQWTVSNNPPSGGAFFSPWFGMVSLSVLSRPSAMFAPLGSFFVSPVGCTVGSHPVSRFLWRETFGGAGGVCVFPRFRTAFRSSAVIAPLRRPL
jgi:hypothetical protein